ncbi:MAG TPA: DUF748 domain-containing protein, partial [Candidatus Binatia bacterium]|nr:DUF748 domain-containing protein [Candidatus Binatia bacterium]
MSLQRARQQTLDIARHPRTRKIILWVASTLFAIGVLFGLAAPPLIRGKVASTLSEKLHRPVTIEQISINPFALTLAVRGFLMKERQGDTPAVAFDELFVNLEMKSLFRLAPVIKELRLLKPYVSLVRNDDLKYNFQDLIEEFTGGPPGPTPRFALNNIEIIDGKLDFDDRPEKTKHAITQLKIGVPFISSLPAHVDIKVKPEFSAVVNGAPFHLAGDAVLFKDAGESTIGIDIDKLAIAKYLEYSPLPLNFTVPSGELHGKVTAAFKTAKNNPPSLSITGNLGLKELEMLQTGGGQLVKLPSIDILIDSLDVFARKTALKSIRSEGLELHVSRNAEGKINLANLVAAAAEVKPAETKPETKAESNPFIYAIEEIALGSATIHFTDEQVKRPYKTRLDNVNFKVTNLTNETGKKADVELSFESEAKEKFSHAGTLQITPLLAEGKLDVEGLKPGALRPYYDDAIAAEIKDGFFDLSTRYSFEDKEGQAEIKLTELSANLRNLRLELAGQPAPLWRIASLALKDGMVDVAKKTIVIGAVEGKDANGYIQRAADGTLNLARIVKSQSPAPAPGPPAKASDGEWRIDAKQILLERFRVDVDDRSNATPAKIRISDLAVRGDNFSTAKNQRGKATIRARVNDKGVLRLVGTATTNPLNAKFVIDAQDLDITPFQPYLDEQVNFILTGGRAGTKGEFNFAAGGAGPAKVNYQGAVQIADFGAVEKNGQQDLLRWKTLALDALQFDLEPFQL